MERAHRIGVALLPRVVTLVKATQASGSSEMPANQAEELDWDVPTEESENDSQDDMPLEENEKMNCAAQSGGDGKPLASDSIHEVERSWSVHKTPKGTITFCSAEKGVVGRRRRRPVAATNSAYRR